MPALIEASVALFGSAGIGSAGRSAEYRRRGPARRAPLARVFSQARGSGLRPRRRSRNRSQWALIAVLAPTMGLVAARRRLHLPPAVTLTLVSAAPLAVAAATPRRSVIRYVAVGAAYMWAFTITWTLPSDQPEKLRQRLRIHYPVRVDSLIGLGVAPTLRLQRALRDPPRVTPLDRAMTLIYGSWFVPHVLLFSLLLRHKQYVPRAAGRLAAAYHLTTPFYYLVPTAPPWWASEEAGLMGGEVERVRRHVLNQLAGKPRQTEGKAVGNPWGSMPSDHVASAAITAMGLAEIGPIYGAVGWTYAALASFSVVYLGEHYVIDTLVGLAIAVAVHRGEATVTPLIRRVVLELDRLGQ